MEKKDAAPKRTPIGVSWWLANLTIVVVLYCNTAVLLQETGVASTALSSRVGVWFQIFAVFHTWSDENRAFVLYGSPSMLSNAPETPTDKMVNLNLYEHFPLWRGETNRRILTYLKNNQLDSILVKVAQAESERTGNKFEQLFLYQHSWPQSAEGFWVRFGEGKAVLVGDK